MDCKNIICMVIRDFGGMKASRLEEKVLFYGINRKNFINSMDTLQERGIIYTKNGGIIDLADPNIS